MWPAELWSQSCWCLQRKYFATLFSLWLCFRNLRLLGSPEKSHSRPHSAHSPGRNSLPTPEPKPPESKQLEKLQSKFACPTLAETSLLCTRPAIYNLSSLPPPCSPKQRVGGVLVREYWWEDQIRVSRTHCPVELLGLLAWLSLPRPKDNPAFRVYLLIKYHK